MNHHGDRGRGGFRKRGRGRSNFEGRSYDNGGSHTRSGFGGDGEGSGFGGNNTASGFGRSSSGQFRQDEGFGRKPQFRGGYRQEASGGRWNDAVNNATGGFGGLAIGLGAQENATSSNDSRIWPGTDAVSSSGGFGTVIDDNSFFNYSKPSAPSLPSTGTQDLSRSTGFNSAAVPSVTGFGSAAVPSVTGFGSAIPSVTGFFSDKMKSTVPTNNQNATARKESDRSVGGFGAAPTQNFRATDVQNTNTQQKAEHGNGLGAVQQTFTPINDTRAAPSPMTPFGGCIPQRTESPSPHDATFRSRGRNGFGPSRGGYRHDSNDNRRGGSRTASARPSTPPTAGRKSPDEKEDPKRLALVEKMTELLNDDGGIYTSDEEDKPPTPQKDDRAAEATSPPVAIQSEDAVRTEMPDALISHPANYRIPHDDRHSTPNQPSRAPDSPAPKLIPAVAQLLIAQTPAPEDDEAEKVAIADSILMTLLTDPHLRQILKTHSPVLFDNMVKHVAVVAETRIT